MNISRLDTCEDWKVVHWYRAQASSHNLQGVIDGRVDEAGMNTAALDRRAVLCGWMHQGKGGYSHSCCPSTPAGASKPPQECDVSFLPTDSRWRWYM